MKVTLKNVRLAFPDLFVATTVNGAGDPAYRAVFLMPEDGPLKAEIDKAVEAVAVEKWKTKAKSVLLAVTGSTKDCCWHDGAKKTYDGYAGHWYLSANRKEAKGRVLVLDADKTPLAQNDGRPYAGCYVNATVELWAQDNVHGKAIRAELLGVQFLRDGDAFAAGSTGSVDDFEDVTDGANAAAGLV